MNRLFFILSILLANVLSSFPAQAQSKGRWVFDYAEPKRTEKIASDADKRMMGSAIVPISEEFIFKSTSFTYKDTRKWWRFSSDYTSKTSISDTQERTVSWNPPPSEILFGEEERARTDMNIVFIADPFYEEKEQVMRDGSGRMNYDVSISIYDTNGNMIISSNSVQIPQKMRIHAGATFKNTTAQGSYGVNYWYHYEGDDYSVTEVTTEASDEEGEDDGTEIPWIPIVIFLPPTIWIGTKILKNSSSGKGANNQDSDQAEDNDDSDEDEDKRPSSFDLVFYKEFGNTLVIGDEPRRVGARIVEITADGERIDRPDLTAKISVIDKENVCATNRCVYGRYQSAMVQAVLLPDGSCPESATVTFSFITLQGRLTKNVVFHVEDTAEIVVGEAITFAAGHKKTQFMEFFMKGAARHATNIDVALESGFEHFSYTITRGDEDGYYRINFTEQGILPDEADTQPGHFEHYNCIITAQMPGPEGKKLQSSFQVGRVHLGLQVKLHALKAYTVERGSNDSYEKLPTRRKDELEFAQSRVEVAIFTVNDKDELICPIPSKDPEFTFEDLYDNDREKCMLFCDRDGKEIKEPCKLLEFKYQYRHVLGQHVVHGSLFPTQGYLEAPNRSLVRVTVKAIWNGKTFSNSIVVPLISQPYREEVIEAGENYVDAYVRYDKLDAERTRKLEDMLETVKNDRRFVELVPLYYKVRIMLLGYHRQFGYHEPDYNGIDEIFHKFTRGDIGTAFVNNYVIDPNHEDLDAALKAWKDTESTWTYIAARIGLGIVTAGTSEIVLAPMSAVTQMKEYVDKGGDSVWGAIGICSVTVIRDELIGKGIETAIKYRGVLKTAYNKLKDAAAASRKSFEVSKSLSKAGSYTTKDVADGINEGIKNVKKAKSFAEVRAESLINKTKASPKKVKSFEAAMAERSAEYSRKDGMRIVKEFQEVMNNPLSTPEQCRRATLAIQRSKSAQEVLKASPSDLLRANYNAQMKELYKEVDEVFLTKIAQKHPDLKKEQFFIQNATGNDAQQIYEGLKVPADRDVTLKYKTKSGAIYDVPEQVQTMTYSEAFFEVTYKDVKANEEALLRTLRQYDQAVVHPVTGLESYADDLIRIIDKSRQTERLVDPQRIQSAFVDKCKVFFDDATIAHKNAMQLIEQGFAEEAYHIYGYGESLVKEGIRQEVKQFERIIAPRLQALGTAGKTADFTNIAIKNSILKNVQENVISLQMGREVLMSNFGQTIEQTIEEIGSFIPVINNMLPVK